MSNGWLAQGGSISGHVFRVDRARGPVWFAKYRLPDGRQVQKKIGPAWTKPGRPDDGFVNRRSAEAWLSDVLAQAHAGTLPGMVRTGVTFERAGAEWLRYCVEDRACKPSTLSSSRRPTLRRASPTSSVSPEMSQCSKRPLSVSPVRTKRLRVSPTLNSMPR